MGPFHVLALAGSEVTLDLAAGHIRRLALSEGHRASVAPNPLSRGRIPTALSLDPHGRVAVRNVIGAIALPDSGAPVAAAADQGNSLLLRFDDGLERAVPFDSAHLAGA